MNLDWLIAVLQSFFNGFWFCTDCDLCMVPPPIEDEEFGEELTQSRIMYTQSQKPDDPSLRESGLWLNDWVKMNYGSDLTESVSQSTA